MKKYGMIFLSAIFTLLIMLIPNQEVKAEELETKVLDYNSWGSSHFDGASDELVELVDYLESLGSNYYYVVYGNSNSIEIKVYKNKNKYNKELSPSISYEFTNDSVNFRILTNVEYAYSISTYFKVSENNFESQFETLKTNITNNNFTNSKYTSMSSSSTSSHFFNSSKIIVYATNIDNFYLMDSSVYNVDIDNFIYQPGNQLPTYYEYKFAKKIDISSSFVCDLNDKEMEFVTIDFSDYDTLGYSYQYGIQRLKTADIVWFDIVNIGNYIYQFNEYYNGTYIYARVLDSFGNEVAVSEYKINNDELPKFGLSVSSGLACPIPNYDGDPQAEIINVDFRNAYDESYKYYYYYDSKTKYEIDLTSDNLVYQIVEYLYQFIYFEIRDENDNLIYYYYNDVSSSDRLGFIPDDYEDRHKIKYDVSPSCDLQNNEILVVSFNFSDITKYVNHYNFDVVINGKHLGAIQYYEVILNESNYSENLSYEVKIYIDDYLYLGRNYSVGDVSSSFDDMYNDILNDLTSSDIDDNESLFNLFINSLNHFKDVIIDIFNNCTYFFNNLDSTLKYFYVSIFSLIVFGFLIRFIL